MICDVTKIGDQWRCDRCGDVYDTQRRPAAHCGGFEDDPAENLRAVPHTVDTLLLCSEEEAIGREEHWQPVPPCLCVSEIAATIRHYQPRVVILGAAAAQHREALQSRPWKHGPPEFRLIDL